uniref:Tubulin glycylase 3A n=1 Tax=Anopheles epiroticus TaxID=199890 RepID=A0A182PIX4_9DIPT
DDTGTGSGRAVGPISDTDKDTAASGGGGGGSVGGGSSRPTTSTSTTIGKVIEGNLGPLTATVKFINPYKNNWINADRLNELRKKVQDATKHHRVFLLRGSFHTVRRALVERGWVEKLDGFRVKAQASTSSSGFILEDLVSQLPERKPGESRKNHIAKCERSIMSRFLEHTPIDFLWTARREKADWLDLTKNSSLIINRFAKAPFTTKEGLCSALHDFHWFYEEGMSETYFPRCYNVWNPEELNEFVDNFRLTASMGLLKWLIERHATEEGLGAIIADDGNVPSTCITFALTRCKEYLDYCLHNDIDIEEDTKVWDHDWDVFLTHHYLLTHEDNRIQLLKEEREADAIDHYLAEAKSVLEQIKGYWPQYALDGYLNIWIVKPGNKCRGRGIHLMNNIKQIIAMVNPPIVSKTRYVIQKYIERPLIIHNTKFDIRQWFMITSVQPLNIWFYKESYLRFSSQQYNLMNYHESVHLTNHAIQKKYHNAVRDERLPHENMWDCHTFQAYLRQIDKYEMWSERIYPGMQKAIIGSLLACQDNMDRRPNTFELYGADFMITEDFYPWLIEINSSPDLAPSTSVTARLCPQCVEDTIRVVIDRRTDSNAPTGSFELIYKQVIPKTPAYMGLNLQLRGHRITPKSSIKKDRMRMLPLKPVQNVLQVSRLATSAAAASVVKQPASPVIMDLIECMQFRDGKPDDDMARQHGLVRGPCGVTSATLYKRSNFSHKTQNLRYDFEKKKSYIISKTGEMFRRNGERGSGAKYLTDGDTYIDSVEAWERATTSFFQHNFSNALSSLTVSNGGSNGRERTGSELSDEGQSRPPPGAGVQSVTTTSAIGSSSGGTSKCTIKVTDCDDCSSQSNSDSEKRAGSVENISSAVNGITTSHAPSGGFPAAIRYSTRHNNGGRTTTSNNFYTLGFSLRTRPPKSVGARSSHRLHHAQSAEDLPRMVEPSINEMHLKLKFVTSDVWDSDPGVDLADITLELGEIEYGRKLDQHFEQAPVQLTKRFLKGLPAVESPANVFSSQCASATGDDRPLSPLSRPFPNPKASQHVHTFPRITPRLHTLEEDDDSNRTPKHKFFRNYSFDFLKQKQLKAKIASAVEKKHIFSIVGHYPALRKALKTRHWLEKQTFRSALLRELSHHALLQKASNGNEYEEALVSKYLKPYLPYFIWQHRNMRDCKQDRFYAPYRSRIHYERPYDFAVKENLIRLINASHWHQEEGFAELDYPRTYLLDTEDIITKFQEDYQLTIVSSFLYHMSKHLEHAFDDDGTLPTDVLTIAMKYLRYYLGCAQHEDIDHEEFCEPLLTQENRHEMEQILAGEAQFGSIPGYEVLSLVAQVKKLVHEAAKVFPDMKIDGIRNMWILKPGNRCRGLGIMIFNDDRKLLEHVDSNPDVKYVAQKYIERPLLIHSTKFDIRQYFLITYTNNVLKVWMYKNCYLRFSSRQFNLDDFCESIHLTNYSIQKNYAREVREGADALPASNMWSLKRFQEHLQSLDKGFYWERKIYPDMKKNILAIVCASLDGMKMERNMFELYGADFMVTENFRTMLIEINTSPDLSSSTDVTSVICPAVQEDLVKVVIDNTKDKRAGTGQFELIHSLEIPRVAPYGYGLTVDGRSMQSKHRAKSPLSPINTSTGPTVASTATSTPKRSTAAPAAIAGAMVAPMATGLSTGHGNVTGNVSKHSRYPASSSESSSRGSKTSLTSVMLDRPRTTLK